MSTREATTTGEPYKNPDFLRQKHEVEGKNATAIADEVGASPATILKYLRRANNRGHLDFQKHQNPRRDYDSLHSSPEGR